MRILLLLCATSLLAGATGGPWLGRSTTATVREFEIVAERFKFTPERIEVNQGDTVRVTVKSADATHSWAVEAFDVDILAKKGGRPETQEFVADKAGTFPVKCSEYCGRGHERMKGVLVVNPGGRS
jgi:cytochrome c oxidase subunit 2